MKRIDKLTDEQTAQMNDWAKKWITIGLDTAPANRPKFEAAAADCYKFANLKPPAKTIWVQSPLVLVIAATIADYLIASKVKTSSGVDFEGALQKALGTSVGAAVKVAVDAAVGTPVKKLSKASLKAALKNTESNWSSYLGGQFWVGGWWGSPAFVSFFREVCGLELDGDLDERAKAFQATCESAGWWWPHTDFVMVCDKPKHILRDEQGRLHSQRGNAVEFRDGWGIASWHGTTIPLEWVTNKDLDPSIALTDPSIERRRAAAEIIGWAKILKSLPHRVIEADPDPEIGTLLSVDLPDAPDSRFVLVRCGTGRDFALPVPREMTTALQANAWSYSLEPLDLKNLETRT